MSSNDPTTNEPTGAPTNDPTADRSTGANPTTALPVTPDPRPLTDTTPTDTTHTDPTPTRSASTAPSTARTATTTATGSTASAVTTPTEGPWLQGPAPFAIVLGLLGLLVAGATLLTELTDLRFPWADLGPWTVVAAGLVVVLVGAIGLRSSRRSQA